MCDDIKQHFLLQNKDRYISAPISVTDYVLILNALEFMSQAGKYTGSTVGTAENLRVYRNIVDILIKAELFPSEKKDE